MRGTYGAGDGADARILAGTTKTFLKTQTRGIIFCHGSGDNAAMAWQDQAYLFLGLSEFASVAIADLGGETWANLVGVAKVHAEVLYLRSQGVVGPIGLVAMSMGHAVACAYARAYPENVAFIAGVIPLIDIRNAYTFAGPGIDAAYASSKKIDYAWNGSGIGSTSSKTIPGGPTPDVNRVLYPYPNGVGALGSQGWGGGGTGADMATVEAGDGFLRRRVRRTFTTTVPSGSIQAIYCGVTAPYRMPVTPGESLYMWMKTRHNFTASFPTAIRAQFFTSGGAVVSSPVFGSKNVTPGAATVVGGQVTVPATAGLVQIDARGTAPSNQATGTYWEASEAYMGANPSETAYFDGSMPDVFGFNEYVDGPVSNPIQMSLNSSIPHKLWAASSDPFTPIEIAQAYDAAHPEVELVNLGAWGHTDAAVTIATPDIVAYARKLLG